MFIGYTGEAAGSAPLQHFDALAFGSLLTV